MRIKFTVFGHDIVIRPVSDTKFHISQNTINLHNPNEWIPNYFDIDKRVRVYIEYDGFIKYIFRDFDKALLIYRESALILLEDVLKSLKRIREKFALRGASEDQLLKFDKKVYECFEKTINVIRNRINDANNYNRTSDMEILKILESYKIYDYYK